MTKAKPPRFLNPNKVKLYSLEELKTAPVEKDNESLRDFFASIVPEQAKNIDYTQIHPCLNFTFTVKRKVVAKGFIDIVFMHGEILKATPPDETGFIIL